MLKFGYYPTYEEQDIKLIIEALLQSEKELGLEICSSYAKNGIYFLRDLEKNHI